MGQSISAPARTMLAARANGTQTWAVVVMGGTEQKEGNGKKYIAFVGTTSTETSGLQEDVGGGGWQPTFLSGSRIKLLISQKAKIPSPGL